MWQVMEFAKRFMVEEVWPEELLAKKPEYRGKNLYQILFENGVVNKFPFEGKIVDDRGNEYGNQESAHSAITCRRAVRGIRRVRPRPCHDLAPFDTYHKCAGCAGPWWMARRPCGVSARAMTLRRQEQPECGQGRCLFLREQGWQGEHHLRPL